jgi:peptide/nickel transport system substrate-binding protein
VRNPSGRRRGQLIDKIGVAFLCATLPAVGACRNRNDDRVNSSRGTTLNVGVAQLSPASPIAGLRQLSQLLALESLARAGDDGRMQPWLAESWTSADDGRSVVVKLKPGVKFQDGEPFDAATAAKLLPDILRSFMGPLAADVISVKSLDPTTVTIQFRQVSPFLLEALEATIRKPGQAMIGTGPFMVEGNSTTDLRANNSYYQGIPAIERITVSNHASVRAAWAEMLRNRLDMLWEVGSDALDSMKNSNSVSLFTYTRHYQHVIVFNTNSAALRSAELRRGLSFAVDRPTVVRAALREYGIPSSGPISPRHWAFPHDAQQFGFDARQAADLLAGGRRRGGGIRFTCLVPPDSIDERIALEVKRQLAAIGVDMAVEEASRDELLKRAASGQYDAAMAEAISGPTLFRPYLMWYTKSPFNWGHFGNTAIDASLDAVRQAPSETAYRTAVARLQQTFMDDPPAIFLAWSVRARAVSKRFDVQADEGRDVLSTIRLWKPKGIQQRTSRN